MRAINIGAAVGRRTFAAAARPRHTKRVRPVVASPPSASAAPPPSASVTSPPAPAGAVRDAAPAARKTTEPDYDELPHASMDGEMGAVLRMLTTDAPKHDAELERFRERVLVAEQHLENGRFAEAIQVYEDAACRFKPNHYFGELYLGLGCAFVGLHQHAHAVLQFRKGLECDPESISLLMNLGLAQVVLEDKAAALATFRHAAKVADAAQEDHHLLQLQLYCGQLLEDLGDDRAALECYEEALKRGPDYSQLWYLAGCVYAKLEQTPKALTYLRKAIACTEPWPSAYYKLSKMVAEPMEKRKLFSQFIAAQREMAESGMELASLLGSGSGLV